MYKRCFPIKNFKSAFFGFALNLSISPNSILSGGRESSVNFRMTEHSKPFYHETSIFNFCCLQPGLRL
jgi:hypothetical protein